MTEARKRKKKRRGRGKIPPRARYKRTFPLFFGMMASSVRLCCRCGLCCIKKVDEGMGMGGVGGLSNGLFFWVIQGFGGRRRGGGECEGDGGERWGCACVCAWVWIFSNTGAWWWW